MVTQTSYAAVNTVFKRLKLWNCHLVVFGKCFDTTASNTEHINGACTLLKDAFDAIWFQS